MPSLSVLRGVSSSLVLRLGTRSRVCLRMLGSGTSPGLWTEELAHRQHGAADVYATDIEIPGDGDWIRCDWGRPGHGGDGKGGCGKGFHHFRSPVCSSFLTVAREQHDRNDFGVLSRLLQT